MWRQAIDHAVPRTVGGGERALYHALYPARHALYSSDEFCAQLRPASAARWMISAAFHVVFGKTVPDISLNARGQSGLCGGVSWLRPVYPGDTLRATL